MEHLFIYLTTKMKLQPIKRSNKTSAACRKKNLYGAALVKTIVISDGVLQKVITPHFKSIK